MGGIFGGDSTPAPIPPPEPASRSDADVQASALAARQRRASTIGRTETILAKGSDDKKPATKTLLGSA